MKRCVVVGGALALISALSGASPVRASEALRPAGALEVHDSELRKKFGLSSDIDDIKVLYRDADQSQRASRAKFDMLLSPDEYNEMERRSGLGELQGAVQSLLASEPYGDAYGGQYIDHTGGGVMVIRMVRGGDAASSALTGLLGRNAFRVMPAKQSWKQLLEVAEGLRSKAADYGQAGFALTGFGPSARLGGLVVDTSGPTTALLSQLQRDFPGTTFEVRQSQAITPGGVFEAGLPIRAGIGQLNISEGPGCTNGFTGYRNTTPTTYYVLTSGHCGRIVNPNNIFGQEVPDSMGTAGGYGRIGPMDKRSFALNVPADAGRIRLERPEYKSNHIVFGPNNTLAITTQAGWNTYNEDAVMCNSTTRWMDSDGDYTQCGFITNSSYDYKYSDKWMTSFSSPYGRLTNIKMANGDSGGPVYQGSKAVGIMAAFLDNNDMIFAHIYDALRSTDVHGVWTG